MAHKFIKLPVLRIPVSLSLSLSPVFYYYLSLSREILQVPHSFGVSLTLNCCHVSHIKYVDSGIV